MDHRLLFLALGMAMPVVGVRELGYVAASIVAASLVIAELASVLILRRRSEG
jgi:hypothetical protein